MVFVGSPATLISPGLQSCISNHLLDVSASVSPRPPNSAHLQPTAPPAASPSQDLAPWCQTRDPNIILDAGRSSPLTPLPPETFSPTHRILSAQTCHFSGLVASLVSPARVWPHPLGGWAGAVGRAALSRRSETQGRLASSEAAR